MENKYILGIDQSTQGTKALLFDSEGKIIGKSYLPHDHGNVPEEPQSVIGLRNIRI